VVDLLDTKGISWAEYQEDLPYAGFQGFNYSNQQSFANDYVRKHNPLIVYDSVTGNATRLSLIKSLASFDADLAAKTLPQWAFITPNMTNDGHGMCLISPAPANVQDTNVTFASEWEHTWLANLLTNDYFMANTLVMLTFDESETYPLQNKIFAVLIGGAIPDALKGTTDDTFYNHYSTISTASVNWGLPSLGRWDCNANVFALVADKTGYKNQAVDTTNLYYNVSNPGPLSDTQYLADWPAPVTNVTCASGQGVLAAVKNVWGNISASYTYSVNPSVVSTYTPASTAGAATSSSSKGVAMATMAPIIGGGLAAAFAVGMAAAL
jgi:acid phosphatase